MIPYLSLAVGGIALTADVRMAWILQLLVSLAIGFAFAGLGFLGHEILHGSVLRIPWARNLAGQICFWPFGIGPRLWRRWHNVEHHGHTQHADDDPDAMHTLEALHDRVVLQWLYRMAPWLRAAFMFVSLSVWFSIHAFQMLLRYAKGPRREGVILWGQFLLPAGFWMALAPLLGWHAWIFAYVLPLLFANATVMSYIATNHLINPLTPVNDPLEASLSVRTFRVLDVLQLNFSHHTEHHIFPAMNPKYAPQVRRLCREIWPEQYNEMPHWEALMVVCLTPRLYLRYNRLLDPVRRLTYPVLGHGLKAGQRLRPERLSDDGA